MVSDELQQAIAWFENRLSSATMPGTRKMFGMALLALREKQERESQKPLTLDELLEMDGQPVFIVTKHGSNWDIVNVSKEDGGPYPVYFQRYGRGLQENGYGEAWRAYRTKPKEAQP